jgi:protein-disulfide isomerase
MSTSPSSTRQQQHAERRTARQAARRAAAGREARRRRTLRLGAAGLLATAIVAVAVAVSSSGGTPAAPAAGEPVAGGREAAALVAGLRERDGVLGDPSAPLTITEYVDLQCPVCARASATTLPTLVRDYVRTGKARLHFRTLHFIGPDSERAARVAAGAERQGKLFRFLEVFYANQGAENGGYVTDAFLRRVAAAAGVDAGAALRQADSAFATQRLQRADADAARLGVAGTPTFTVAVGGGPAHVLSADVLEPAAVGRALDAELAG